MSRILITGATGFLGRHLVDVLLARGDDVVALVRRDASLPEGVAIARGDVLDGESVAAAARGCESVMHCAGKVSRKLADAEELHRVHVQGTKIVLDACRQAGVRRAVIASSSGTMAVSADPDFVATESHEADIGILNRWPYYRAKLFAERAAFERNVDGFEVVCANPTLLLGPGDAHGSSTEDVRLFLERKIPVVPPGGISFVDVRDAALGMALALDRGRAGERYLFGACNLTLREFFARLERVSGTRAPVLPVPRAPELARIGGKLLDQATRRLGIASPVDPVSLDMSQFYWYLDATKAETELGWTPRDPLATLVETVNDLRDRGVVWPSVDGSLFEHAT